MFRSLELRSLQHRWFGRRGQRASASGSTGSARRRVRPRLEALEDRLTPTTITPTTFADDGTVNSLRGAITQANNDTGTTTDTIQLQPGTYTLSIPNTASNHDVSNAQGDLNITSTSHALVIQGTHDAGGKPTTTITVDQAKMLDRVFEIGQPTGPNGITVTLKDLIIENGFAQDDGGAGTVAGNTEARGGGILDYGGNVTLSNVVVQSNQAVGGSGAGTPHYAEGGGMYALNGALTINNSVLQLNSANGAAGTSAHPDGQAGYGGGIEYFSQNPATPARLNITNSTLARNVAEGGPQAPGSSGKGGDGDGGGIGITTQSNSKVTATIRSSTISDNKAFGGIPGTGGKGQGGGVYFAGDNTGALLQIWDSTVAGNSTLGDDGANPDSGGGGIYFAGGAANLCNLTVADNKTLLQSSSIPGSGGSGGGIDNASPAGSSSTIGLINTLVANNNAAAAPDYSGKVNVSDHNLIGEADGSSGFSTTYGDHLGTIASPLNPQLGPLQSNGGPTQTIALLPGSAAIDAGNNEAQIFTGTNDQRGQGFARISHGTIDIGAFEVEQPPSGGGGGGGNGGTTPPPPSLFQALISLYIDGIELEAFDQAGAAAFKDNFAKASVLEGVLRFFGNPDLNTIQSSIAFNLPYAGPFGQLVVQLGEQALLQAVS